MDLSFLQNLGTDVWSFLKSNLGRLGSLPDMVGKQQQRLSTPTPTPIPPMKVTTPTEESVRSSVGIPEEQKSEFIQQIRKKLGITGGGEKKEGEVKGKGDKMTIQKNLPSGEKVTISVDLPQPTPTPTIIPEFQNVRPDIQEMIGTSLRGAGLESEINNFINLASRESSLNPFLTQQERNPFVPELGRKSIDYGLYQFNDWYQRKLLEELGLVPQDLLDAQTAINAMIELYKRSGYTRHPVTAGSLGLLE